MSFFESLESKMNKEATVETENGALGYKTTGKALLDMTFSIPKYRTESEDGIIYDFNRAYFESPELALLWLFYARDCRGGLGERRLFRVIFNDYCKRYPKRMRNLVPLVAVYGRWDDLLYATKDTPLWKDAVALVKKQLKEDLSNMSEGKPVSLLAKWLPSGNTSNKETVRLAMRLSRDLDMKINEYTKTLSKLREYIKVVERQMSANEWSDIDYSAVPSYANLKYMNAFFKHDKERREKYLESLKNGKTKINSSVAFPHDIVHKYSDRMYGHIADYDETIEQMWKALPNMSSLSNTIVVADGSSSMNCCRVGNSDTTALEVANALAIYCAEHSEGEFFNKYITFSETPQFVDLSSGTSLRDKIMIALGHDEIANTNIEAVFDLILDTAVSTLAKQEEIPANVLIISDMELKIITIGAKTLITFSLRRPKRSF